MDVLATSTSLVDRSNYGYANSPGYAIVLNRATGEPVVAIRAKDNVLLLNAHAAELTDRLFRDELRVELGASCAGVQEELFAVDWDTGIVYVGNAARAYWQEQLEGRQLN
jgi:archaeosine-15-forming tRNA-guanine transglycosylase